MMTQDFPQIHISKSLAQYNTFISTLSEEVAANREFQSFFATQCECKRAGGELGFFAIRHTQAGTVYVVISLPLGRRKFAELATGIVRTMLAEIFTVSISSP